MLTLIRYPSLLQSSDIDGGSSVAVLTYLCRILDCVGHPNIIHLILHYLLALPGPTSSRPGSALVDPDHKPLPAHAESSDATEAPNPSFFNMTDLVLTSCQSQNPETVTAALRLVTIVLDRHHSYAISSLLHTRPILPNTSVGNSGNLRAQIDTMISLAGGIAGTEGMDAAYNNSLRDALAFMEAHPCSSQVLALDLPEKTRTDARGAITNGPDRIMQHHTLATDDPLLNQLVTLLRTFLTNDIETNLGLTGAISHLATCPFVHLEGWLYSEPRSAADADDGSFEANAAAEAAALGEEDSDLEEAQRINSYKSAKRKAPPLPSPAHHPPIHAALHFLANHITRLKTEIPEFSSLLAGRKRAFLGATELENELREPTPSFLSSPRGSIDLSRDVSRSRAVPIPIPMLPPPASAISEARSTSPRGRTLSLLAGQRRQSPAMSPSSFDASRKPTPLMSPSLRAHGGDAARRPSRSPTKAARAMSPLLPDQGVGRERSISPMKSPLSATSPAQEQEEIFDRRLRFPLHERDDTAPAQAATDVHANENKDFREASLTHVLTNVVILQEFILELAAIMHVRAGLLDGEVSFGGRHGEGHAEEMSERISGSNSENEEP